MYSLHTWTNNGEVEVSPALINAKINAEATYMLNQKERKKVPIKYINNLEEVRIKKYIHNMIYQSHITSIGGTLYHMQKNTNSFSAMVELIKCYFLFVYSRSVILFC